MTLEIALCCERRGCVRHGPRSPSKTLVGNKHWVGITSSLCLKNVASHTISIKYNLKKNSFLGAPFHPTTAKHSVSFRGACFQFRDKRPVHPGVSVL
jgi:hypothetical protein